MSTKLSISIVSYHNYDDILKLLETIEKYTDKTITKTVYIIDNGSHNTDMAKVNEFKNSINKMSDIEYIDPKDNIGFGKGHNYILDKIDSEYHAIVNPDILLKEDSFSKIIGYMDKQDDVGMVIPRIVDENGELQKVYRKEVTIHDMFIRMFCPKLFPKKMAMVTLQDKDFTEEFQVPFGQGSFLVVRTELFKKINGFDDRFFMYMEDADLCKRINQESKLMYIPDTEVVHRWEKGSHKNKNLFVMHIKSMFKYFLKWGM